MSMHVCGVVMISLIAGCAPVAPTSTATPLPSPPPAVADAGTTVPDAPDAPAFEPGPPAVDAAPVPPVLGPTVSPGAVALAYRPDGAAAAIFVAGSFNSWARDDAGHRLLDPDGDGIYTITFAVPAGTYQYKLIVDGRWLLDPNAPRTAPDGFGGQNGVFDVP